MKNVGEKYGKECPKCSGGLGYSCKENGTILYCPECDEWLHDLVIKKMEEAITEAWRIINVLNMSEMDRGESYPRALIWQKKWENLRPQ